jgi:hypothetical protein
MKEYKCDECDLVFPTFQGKANHVRWNHKSDEFYINTKKKLSVIATKTNVTKHGEWVMEVVNCVTCNNECDVKYRTNKKKDKYFCSVSCANTREIKGTQNEETKLIISKKIKELWKNGHYDKTTRNNHLKQKKYFTSKNERLIVKYFKENFSGDFWKSGGQLKFNGCGISRDLYSDKLKVCFEYDGVWHFEDIKDQLEHKQMKDKLLEEWCVINDYRLIRVDEKKYVSEQQIVNLIYEQSEQIIKIGDRY